LCGIVVTVNAPELERGSIQTGLFRIKDRGPDEHWLEADAWYAAGFVRLAIESPQASIGSSNDGQEIIALLNGEIWNYRALSSAYGLRGIRNEYDFLREAYRYRGIRLFDDLNGMFAIVIVDKRNKRVVAARDREGIKPLFLYRAQDGMAVTLSSHVAGVQAEDGIALNRDFFVNRFVLGFSDYRNSVIEGIEQVPPSSVVQIEVDGPRSISETWEQLGRIGTRSLGSDEAIVAEQLSILDRAVTDTITHGTGAEVLLLLSGGIDSSLLALLASRLGFKDRMVGVYVGPPGSPDAEWSRYVAREAGIRLLTVQPELDGLFESPGKAALSMGGSSAYTMYWMFARLRKEFPESKVVICGEGADELYLGYPWHADPSPRIERIVRRHSQVEHSTDLINTVLTAIENVGAGAQYQHSMFANTDRTHQLIDAHLLPFDHASMAHGFEVRVPYLATENVAFADSLVERGLHTQSWEQKPLLRQLLRSMHEFPERFMTRPKSGLPNAFDAGFRQPPTEAAASEIASAMPEWFSRIPFPPVLKTWYAEFWLELAK